MTKKNKRYFMNLPDDSLLKHQVFENVNSRYQDDRKVRNGFQNDVEVIACHTKASLF